MPERPAARWSIPVGDELLRGQGDPYVGPLIDGRPEGPINAAAQAWFTQNPERKARRGAGQSSFRPRSAAPSLESSSLSQDWAAFSGRAAAASARVLKAVEKALIAVLVSMCPNASPTS